MSQTPEALQFEATLHSPKTTGTAPDWAFVVLPKHISDQLPRRGRTSVDCQLSGQRFTATLEPDGHLSHWMRLPAAVLDAAGVAVGEQLSFIIAPVAQEPEPHVPDDLAAALAASPDASACWHATTTLARVDWIHWIESAKQERTRNKRVRDACRQLAEGKRRVCCFDVSGFYSKAFCAPEAAEP